MTKTKDLTLADLVGEILFTNIDQGTDEWLHLRAGRLTGSVADELLKEPRSKAARALGELAEGTKSFLLDKIWERLSGKPLESYATTAMEWGTDLEAEALARLAERHELEILPGGFWRDRGAEIGASPDGLLYSDDDELDAIFEVKCPYRGSNHLRHLLASPEDLPRAYRAQMQWNMLVTGAPACYFVSFDPRLEDSRALHMVSIPADAQMQRTLLDGLRRAQEFITETISQLP